MLEKIVTIQAIGRFAKLSSAGDTKLRTLNALFGGNGVGKSTLSQILRSASRNDPAILGPWKRLGTSQPPSIHLRTSDGDLRFDGSSWSGPAPKMLVYDRRFVDDNVHVGGESGPTQRNSLLQLAIGTEEVHVARRIEEIAASIRNLNAKIRPLKERLTGAAESYGMGLQQFLQLQEVNNPEAELVALEVQIVNASKARSILDRAELLMPRRPAQLDVAELTDVLGATAARMSDDARAAVQRHLDERLGGGALQWVTQGLSLQGEEHDCPFCGLDTTESGLVTLYHQYFDESYNELQRRVEDLRRHLADLERAVRAAETAMTRNDANRDYWQDVLQEAFSDSRADEIGAAWDKVRERLDELLNEKQADMYATPDFTSRLNEASSHVEDIGDRIDGYREVSLSYNKKIQALKSGLVSVDLDALRAQKRAIHAAKQRHSANIVKLVAEAKELADKKRELAKEKESANAELKKLQSNRLRGFQDRVNKALKKVGASFQLEDLTAKLTGGRPYAHYAVSLDCGQVPVVGGGPNEPSFRTVLSEGDKSTLAFAIFAANLETTLDPEEHVIVLDDPVNCLDHDRLHSTISIIGRWVEKFGQVVVISHKPRFLRQLYLNTPPPLRKSVRISDASSALEECNLDELCRTEYLRALSRIESLALYGERDVSADQVYRDLRPVLEEYLEFRFPDLWDGHTGWLGDFIGKVRESPSLLEDTDIDVDELTELNDFSKSGHHASSSRPAEPPSANEIRNYATRTYRFIRGSDPVVP